MVISIVTLLMILEIRGLGLAYIPNTHLGSPAEVDKIRWLHTCQVSGPSTTDRLYGNLIQKPLVFTRIPYMNPNI